MNNTEERLLRLAREQENTALVELLRVKYRRGDEEGFDTVLHEQALSGHLDGELLFEVVRIMLDWAGEEFTIDLACGLGMLMGVKIIFDAWNISNTRSEPKVAALLIEVSEQVAPFVDEVNPRRTYDSVTHQICGHVGWRSLAGTSIK